MPPAAGHATRTFPICSRPATDVGCEFGPVDLDSCLSACTSREAMRGCTACVGCASVTTLTNSSHPERMPQGCRGGCGLSAADCANATARTELGAHALMRPTVVVSSVTGRGVAAPALFGISQATVGLGNFEEVAVLKTGAAFSLGLVSFSFVPALVRAPSAKYFLWLSVIFFRSGLVEHLCHVGHYNLLSVAPHGDPAGALPTGVE